MRFLLVSLAEPDSSRRSPVVIRGMPPASPFQSPQKAGCHREGEPVATAPKMKPVKAVPADPVGNFNSVGQLIRDLEV
jgi:hypothetical protein